MNRSSLLARVVALGLVAALAGVLPAAAQFGKNKIQYRDFDWKIYHSPHFDVYYYESEAGLLEKVVSFAESAYDRLSREFDHQIQEPIPLIFYATHSAFEQNNIILNFIPEGIGAFASPVRNRMVLPVDLPDGELFDLVMHELTHIFQYSAIFGGKLGRGRAGAPQWFMEGMASYMAEDEGSIEKMYLRDAVVNDAVPSITEEGTQGYMSYRLGHAAFDFIEDRWGKEGFRDFIYEYRNTLGGRVGRAIERSLRIDPEDFDLDFRRWLRKKYLPQLVATGEPSDFGRPFRDEDRRVQTAISPVASPSGDLVAALTVGREDVDITLFDTRRRRPLANLTKGFPDDYQYLVAQHLTTGPRMGRDLAFSPDGNRLAVFAKREAGRSLVLIDVLRRKVDRVIDMKIEQQHGPSFSPDGRQVAFSGNRDGRFDIFTLDLESEAVTNLTDDEAYDGAPVYTPDGDGLIYSSMVAGHHAQLFRLELSDPMQRTRLTEGPWDDREATFSTDRRSVYFTSNRTGIDNIWRLDLESGEATQFTNVVTGCMTPTVLRGEDGDSLVYAGFWKGKFDLYRTELEEAAVDPEQVRELPGESVEKAAAGALAPATLESGELPVFEPDILVSIDPANQEDYRRSKLFLEDAGVEVGVTDDSRVLGNTYLSFTDQLGDRRLFLSFQSIDSFSNFNFVYANLRNRTTRSYQLFDQRTFYQYIDADSGDIQSDAIYRLTGGIVSWSYPFDIAHRFEFGVGYISREVDFVQQFVRDDGSFGLRLAPTSDDYPVVQAGLVGDTAIYAPWGPVTGRRWRLGGSYGYDTDEGGALTQSVSLDARQYVRLSRRSELAFRLYGYYGGGNRPNIQAIGGLDTVRGFDYRSLFGDRVFFANAEYRFPLIDVLATPALSFQGIRGRIFLDVGGAWADYAGQDFDFWDSEESRLIDGVSAYGWGLTVRFVGLTLNWDFAQTWDLKDSVEDGFRTSFWIGSRF